LIPVLIQRLIAGGREIAVVGRSRRRRTEVHALRRALILFATLLPLAAMIAPAAALGPRATPDEAKKAFFGFDMEGYVEGSNTSWRECIEPAGKTSYWYDGAFDQGKMRVRDDGALCFSYASSGFAQEGCYFAHHEGKNWRFVGETQGDGVFVTRRTRANVRACPGEQVPTS
jgi:hypothetical protein